MSGATAIVEFSPTTQPTATPVWVDISSYVRHISTQRGRTNELSTFDAGVASIELNNEDGRFDPTYAAGPYYGNLKLMRRARIRAGLGGTSYNIFSGFIQGWPQGWPGGGNVSIATLELVDGFKVLALANLGSAIYSAELSSARVTNVLNTVGWPTADRNIRTGQSTLIAGTIDTTALAHLQAVAAAENGRLFMDAGGSLVFHDRHAAMEVTAYNTSQATFGDGAGELGYHDLTLAMDDSQLWTQAIVTPTGGSAEISTSAAGTADYYLRTLKKDNSLVNSQSEAQDAAQYLVHRYESPGQRIETMPLTPAIGTPHWVQALGREIGDRITAKRRPVGGGTISQASFIEGIGHDITPGGAENSTWVTRFQLSPADNFDYWLLGDPTYGLLNSSTRFAY